MVQVRKQNKKHPSNLRAVFVVLSGLLGLSVLVLGPGLVDDSPSLATIEKNLPSGSSSTSSVTGASHRSPLAYGTKSGKEQTAQLVKDAILTGFRHIVTGGHHGAHNETGVGYGWKEAVAQDPSIRRHDLYLQTCFVPWDGKDFQKQPSDEELLNGVGNKDLPSIEDQVHLSIKTSLRNLQSDYIDAVIFHNFRASLHPYDQMIQAWRVLEDYVQKGVIHQLGMTSVHNVEFLERLYNESSVKPSIIQNRFHSNRGYDVGMQATFEKYNLQVQRFWLLNGSSGGGRKNKDMADRKGVTPAQLMLAFVMSLGSNTCLVGTHSLQHMKDDVAAVKCYNTWFGSAGSSSDDSERMEYAQKLGMKLLPEKKTLPHDDEITLASTRSLCQERQQQRQGKT